MKNITANVLSPWKVENGELSAPVVLIKEGVHCGSHGCIFWPSEVLAESAKLWEGKPVTLGHPVKDNSFVSVKERLDTVVGKVTNVRFNNKTKALEGIVRIPISKANVQGVKEVSVGVFSDDIYITGTYDGKQYSAIAQNCIPDHLALLPNERGACSFLDGCGIRANNEAEDLVIKIFNALNKDVETKMKIEPLLPTGLNVNEEKEEVNLTELQAWADANGILLPTEFNRKIKANPNHRTNEIEPLLPTSTSW